VFCPTMMETWCTCRFMLLNHSELVRLWLSVPNKLLQNGYNSGNFLMCKKTLQPIINKLASSFDALMVVQVNEKLGVWENRSVEESRLSGKQIHLVLYHFMYWISYSTFLKTVSVSVFCLAFHRILRWDSIFSWLGIL
jgi:hypothetical protein